MHVSRRELMQAGLAAGIGAALPAILRAQESVAGSRPVITKIIPSTGEKIPVIGVGTNRFGREMTYNGVVDVLRRMFALGGTVIDTAAEYGQSEVVIGKALAQLGLTQRAFIATKFNDVGDVKRRAAWVATLPPDAIARRLPPETISGLDSVRRSLQRLQKIDLLFAHHIASVEPLMPTLLDLKRQGRVRYIGFTTVDPKDSAQVLEYLRKYPFDFLQINYSIGDRWAEAEVFPLARQRKVAIMAAEPLTQPLKGSTHGERSSLFSLTKGRKLPAWAAGFGAGSWSQLFLKYAVSHPAVTCAIPGATKLDHLEDNQTAGLGRLPDAAERRKIEQFWQSIAS